MSTIALSLVYMSLKSSSWAEHEYLRYFHDPWLMLNLKRMKNMSFSSKGLETFRILHTSLTIANSECITIFNVVMIEKRIISERNRAFWRLGMNEFEWIHQTHVKLLTAITCFWKWYNMKIFPVLACLILKIICCEIFENAGSLTQKCICYPLEIYKRQPSIVEIFWDVHILLRNELRKSFPVIYGQHSPTIDDTANRGG